MLRPSAYLISSFRADHQHSHQRDVVCLMFDCSVAPFSASAEALGAPPRTQAEVLRKFVRNSSTDNLKAY